LDAESLAVKQGTGNCSVCLVEYTTKRRSRDVHLCGSLLVLIAFEIGKSDGFELVKREDDELQICHRHPPWLKHKGSGWGTDESLFEWAGHIVMSIRSKQYGELMGESQ
jgi:hypothetical protein